MNSHSQNGLDLKSGLGSGAGAGDAEATLRLIAGLSAPLGLEERVKAALHEVPRSGSLLHWPAGPRSGWMQSTWARTAAAAAIVFVVAGGGWEVYSRVQPAEPPNAIALPPVAAHGGFSSANAIRTPRTLNGTVLTHPLAAPARPDAIAEKKQADRAKKPVKNGKAEATEPIAP
jgi:hypothetical protein